MNTNVNSSIFFVPDRLRMTSVSRSPGWRLLYFSMNSVSDESPWKLCGYGSSAVPIRFWMARERILRYCCVQRKNSVTDSTKPFNKGYKFTTRLPSMFQSMRQGQSSKKSSLKFRKSMWWKLAGQDNEVNGKKWTTSKLYNAVDCQLKVWSLGFLAQYPNRSWCSLFSSSMVDCWTRLSKQ